MFRVMLSVLEKSYPQMNADRRRLKADQDLQNLHERGAIQ